MLLCSLLWMITASICLEWSMADSVTQSPRAITVQDGESVSLNCAYDTNEAYYALYWYKQSPNGELIYIIHQYSESNSGRSGRYSVTFRKSDRTITLNVLSSHLKDSGIYFCGLRRMAQ
uniref:Ig-like domain-containing protein n=1 Tax=Monodelphis domestica TaxID=13616 RepID=A0A5F8G383_MONDO